MLVKTNTVKSSGRFYKYGHWWQPTVNPASMERDMIRRGGRFMTPYGMAGDGTFEHLLRFEKLVFPWKVWHRWNLIQLESYLQYRTIGVIGPASSGKTNAAATDTLADYYCFPECTTIIICSTTKERLEDRIWGEIKRYHKEARRLFGWLPGNLIEGKQRIVTDPRSAASEGRDFRNGVVGVPCKRGHDFVGMGDFAGIKNKRVRLAGDELSLLPRVFVDAISNLDKNPDFKCIGMGNPKETTDALGILCEPAAHLGGWDAGIDQVPKTKTWETRRPNGICIQLVGTDSPNLDGKLGIPLITQEQIDRDVAFYGRDSVWFTMMNQGMMPRGQGSRRVLTRPFAIKHKAMEPPLWSGGQITKIGFLDAAYRGVGGDRCIFGELNIGSLVNVDEGSRPLVEAIINQRRDIPPAKQILALIDTVLVPIKPSTVGSPVGEVEDQIVTFVMAECQRRGIPPENFFYDSGMRTTLVQSFMRLWSKSTNSIDCGGIPSDRKVSEGIDVLCKDYYSKRITEFWFSVRLTVETEQFRGMTEEVLMEFCAREWTRVGANKIEVEPKEKMKEKTGRSPDLADAVAIGVEGARQRGFVIARLGSVKMAQETARWKSEFAQKQRSVWRSKDLDYRA